MTSPIGRPRTLGDSLPALIVKIENLRTDLRDVAENYRSTLRELSEQILAAAFDNKSDDLPALIVKREKLKADLRDTAAAYRDQIKEIDEQVKEAAFNADQIVMAFTDSTPEQPPDDQ